MEAQDGLKYEDAKMRRMPYELEQRNAKRLKQFTMCRFLVATLGRQQTWRLGRGMNVRILTRKVRPAGESGPGRTGSQPFSILGLEDLPALVNTSG
jgi:hypothetical protein